MELDIVCNCINVLITIENVLGLIRFFNKPDIFLQLFAYITLFSSATVCCVWSDTVYIVTVYLLEVTWQLHYCHSEQCSEDCLYI